MSKETVLNLELIAEAKEIMEKNDSIDLCEQYRRTAARSFTNLVDEEVISKWVQEELTRPSVLPANKIRWYKKIYNRLWWKAHDTYAWVGKKVFGLYDDAGW